MERFRLKKYGELWACSNLFTGIVCTFDEKKFNDTQEFTGGDPNMGADILAKRVNEMGEWRSM